MRTIKKLIVSILVFVICFGGFYLIKPGKMNDYSWSTFISYDKSDEMIIYYNSDEQTTLYGAQQVGAIFLEQEARSIDLSMSDQIKMFQIHFGYNDNDIELKDSYIQYLFFKEKINLADYAILENASVSEKSKEAIKIKKEEGQSYILYDMSDEIASLSHKADRFFLYIYLAFSVIVALIVYRLAGKVKLMLGWLRDILSNRRLIFELSKSDFKMRYAGSNLGVVWAFIQPIVTVMIYVFVFQYGFKSVPVENVPYVLWLIAGIVPWFYLSEALMNSTNSLLEYSYLVKKVVFKINILPMVKIMSAIYVHLFFIMITISLYLINGIPLTRYVVQIIYYTICTTVFVLGLAYITSSIVLFFRDLSQIVNIILQFGMWLTPIMWSVNMLGPKWKIIMKLNPMYYITDGYRDALYNKVWFFEKLGQTMYFWVLSIMLLLVGTTIFKKLERHFADVL